MTTLFTPLRETVRRLLRRPPSDWAGPDWASEAVRLASPIEPDNGHDVIWMGPASPDVEARLDALERRGHRVHREAAGVSALGATVVALQDSGWIPAAERLGAANGWPVLRLPDSSAPSDEAFAERLAGAFPLISIVIVTYNNRDVNRLCLESLFARTEWPRFEVFVVDNGSTDGTPELLAELAGRHPNLRVLALPENRGFPAACNVGLARAAGDPLVLLNNDTVLTRGWLTALFRHLAKSPRLGMVGPVTNAIANEARIEVGYSGLGGLPGWAAEWVRAHEGETFAIPMLAFFCVALRRAVFESVGPLDERFGLGLFEDGDYNRRVRAAGWEILCARDAFVHHWQNASFRRLGKDAYFALYEANRKQYDAKWRAPKDTER